MTPLNSRPLYSIFDLAIFFFIVSLIICATATPDQVIINVLILLILILLAIFHSSFLAELRLAHKLIMIEVPTTQWLRVLFPEKQGSSYPSLFRP
jgi:formate hydrogenlyase subunit 4